MKLFVAVIAMIAATAVALPANDQYTSKYDGIDIDEILKSERLFQNYYKCLNEAGKCTPDGRELKRILPDALQTECSKCNEKQRAGADKVLRFLIEKKPEEWKILSGKYDPQGVYIEKYRTAAEKRGITI